MKNSSTILIIILSIVSLLLANVKLPAIISDNMVLLQNAEVVIWGWAEPGEKISIVHSWSTNKNSVRPEAIANECGKWSIVIKTPKAGGPYTLTIKSKNTIERKNILIGEVWLCSGQSNMNLSMEGEYKQPIQDGPEDIASSGNKSIRLFRVKYVASDKVLDDVIGEWVECLPETVKKFSAVGYYFGRNIYNETGYPVGLICSSWGGTLAQAWTPIEYINNNDNLSRMIGMYYKKIEEWEKVCVEKEQNKTLNQTAGPRPEDKPASLYNGMIAPITNMTIRGTIWYQGESNTDASYLYRDLFPTMINSWRCKFNNFEMPFYFVQLANYTAHMPGLEVKPYRGQPRENNWAELREAQLMANSLKNTGMAVTIDIGETNNIHPCNKKDVSKRLALWALAKDYGKDIEFSGPLYAGYNIEDNKVRIFFSHVGKGLIFKGGKAKGFAIAGKNRKFVWADARIDGKTILVFNCEIKEPVAVRYAWDIDPENNLYNRASLPASPFRTDNWNGVTVDAIW